MSFGEIAIPDSFASLSVTDIRRSEQTLGALWSAADPSADVQTGSLQALVLRPFASLLETAKTAFREGGRQSDLSYLLEAEPNTVLPLLDAAAKNYRIERKRGTPAFGTLRLVFSRRIIVSVGSADIFTANGIEFSAVQQTTSEIRDGYPSGMSPFFPMPDDSGYVYIDVAVQANQNGFAGNLMKGTEAESPRGNIPYFVRAFAVNTFTGGSDDESDADMIQRMLYGISAKVLSSRTNMHASLLEVFPDIRDSSVIGAGDEEMTRDKHSVFPGSTGGYADWYIASSRQLQTASAEMTHFQKIRDLPDGTTEYGIDILEEHFPGLYWVSEIADTASNVILPVLSQTKRAAADEPDAPRIDTDEEAAFTIYQLTDVRFAGPPNLQTIRVNGTHMPLLKEIQHWVLRCGQSPLGLDILVKGAVPVSVYFSASVHTPLGTEPDFTEWKQRISDYVNSIPFDGVLSVSGLTALMHSMLPEGSYVSSPALFASLHLSDTPAAIPAVNRLILNVLPFGTNRTCILYCDPADVNFSHHFIESRC